MHRRALASPLPALVPLLAPVAFACSVALVASSALVAPLRAQSFNVDVGVNVTYPVPSDLYAGAAQQSGRWNDVPPIAATTALASLDGSATSVTLECTRGVGLQSSANLVGASADELALLADVGDPGSTPVVWTFQGLADGAYDVFTYAIAPDSSAFVSSVAVFGSTDAAQLVGGAWPGAQVQGVTYALHRVHVANGSPVAIAVERAPFPPLNYASVNGFQLVLRETATPFCAGDGIDPSVTTPCPCANFGAPGRGCASSVNAAGALLEASGTVVPDTLVLVASGMPASAPAVFLQGDLELDVPFGDGILCASGALVRLRARVASMGVASLPEPGELPLSAQGAVVPGAGVRRVYQAFYRNAAALFCPPELFNVTSGIRVAW